MYIHILYVYTVFIITSRFRVVTLHIDKLEIQTNNLEIQT